MYLDQIIIQILFLEEGHRLVAFALKRLIFELFYKFFLQQPWKKCTSPTTIGHSFFAGQLILIWKSYVIRIGTSL